MRKRIVTQVSQPPTSADEGWLDVERLALAEVTSEDPERPIESALLPGGGPGWRASQPGPQTIRLIFDSPQRLKRMLVVFEEGEAQRSQEFVLRWSPDHGRSFREIVRQQWTFSPPGTTREVEDYAVDLAGVTEVELTIVPGQAGVEAHASLSQWRLA
jgi:hypothetical protein